MVNRTTSQLMVDLSFNNLITDELENAEWVRLFELLLESENVHENNKN
jgi:uncharacterized protein with PhoU and TrkA domain